MSAAWAPGAAPLPVVAPGNAQHQGRRESQQDSFGFSDFTNTAFIRHGGYLAVLSDGMGGMEHGAFAAIQGVRVFREAYQAKSLSEAPQDALERAARRANAVVHAEAARLHLVDRMGATLVAAALVGDRLHWVNAGDSRLYLFEHGVLTQLTTDHNYGERLAQQVREGQISAAEARAHPLRNTLTAYLGRPEPMELTRSPAPRRLSPGAWVLMCSDGLSGVLSPEQMSAELHGTPQAACQRLVDAAVGRGLRNQDNTTVMVMHLPVGQAPPDFGSVSRLSEKAPRRRTWLLRVLGLLTALALSAIGLSLWLLLRPPKPEPLTSLETLERTAPDSAPAPPGVPQPTALPTPPLGLGRSPEPQAPQPAKKPRPAPSTAAPASPASTRVLPPPAAHNKVPLTPSIEVLKGAPGAPAKPVAELPLKPVEVPASAPGPVAP